MKKRDVLELKKRIKKDSCTFTKMCGCYVNSEKNILLDFNKTFLNLDEDEFFKYMDIAKKVLSGTIGNNLLELEFPMEDFQVGGPQEDLIKLKDSKLKDENLLNEFYQNIIDHLDYVGNYLILLFHDAYDVITKTKDKLKVDESEEVYEYILCAICPVELTKPGLKYFDDENKIGAMVRDWAVEMPALGFLFPAFTDRSSDISTLLYYAKNPKDTHPELMEEALGCPSKKTATEQKESFKNIIVNAAGGDEKLTKKLAMEIHDTINSIVDENYEVNGESGEPVILTSDLICNVLSESGVDEEISEKIEKSFVQEFGEAVPPAEHILDSKIVSQSRQLEKEENLKKQVQLLEMKLENTQLKLSENNDPEEEMESALTDSIEEEKSHYDILLKVKPEKVDQIKSQVIDGKKCLIIPVDEDEQAKVNGMDAKL